MSFLKKIKVAAKGIEDKDIDLVLEFKNDIAKMVKAEAEVMAKQVYDAVDAKVTNKANAFAKSKNLEPNATDYVFMQAFEAAFLKKLMNVNTYAEVINSVESSKRYY